MEKQPVAASEHVQKMDMFETIKKQNLVISLPEPHNMERLAVEVFKTSRGFLFFDVGWCVDFGSHPIHEIEGHITWNEDHWIVSGGRQYNEPVRVEIFSRHKHPELIGNNDTWERYKQTQEGRKLATRERARSFVASQII